MEPEIVRDIFMEDDGLLRNATAALVSLISQRCSDEVETVKLYTQRELEIHNTSIATCDLEFETMISHDTDAEYFEHFRMSRSTMKRLIQYLETKMSNSEDTHRISLEKKVHLTVWTLANKESYREIGNLFGVEKSTVAYIFHEICEVLAAYRKDWIKSQAEQQAETKIYVRGFPNVVGFIDGTHIQIKAPAHNPTDFYNRKEVHSVIMQAVCNHKLEFVDVFIGQTGRAHDARVFRESQLSQKIKDLVLSSDHILADSAYTLLQNVMIPYRDNGHLSPQQLKYNITYAKYRSTIERAFGRLKRKFRTLHYLEIVNIKNLTHVICTACVLHNFILYFEPIELQIPQNNWEPELQLEGLSPVQKRDVLCNYIHEQHV